MKQVFWAALALAAAIGMTSAAGAHDAPIQPPWQQASAWPDRIVVTFAADPARTLAVNWRTSAQTGDTFAEIARATSDARFDLTAARQKADSETVTLDSFERAAKIMKFDANAGLAPVSYHSVLFTGLEPDTLYAYRVSGLDGKWSEWFQVRTAPLTGPISFLYLGDAQNGILSHWARAIRAAYAKAPDARFVLHAGDMVDQASRDYEWASWFKSVGHIHGMIPAVPVTGNHEYFRFGEDRATAERVLSVLWRPQFRLPTDEDLPDVLRETVYAVRYNDDLEVFVLDTTNSNIMAQEAWLDAKLKASTARWKVVSFHHPIFSSGRDRDNKAIRERLLPVLVENNVDLVLQGHDHTYARGGLLPENAPQRPARAAAPAIKGIGAMFVNSVSGAKQYDWSKGRWAEHKDLGVKLDRMGENSQFFQLIRIDGAALTYEAYTVDGALYDRFALSKAKDGVRTLTSGAPANLPPERLFSNTLPYPGTDGLNQEK